MSQQGGTYMSEETPVMRAPLAGALTNNDTQNLPVVIGVDLGGTQFRTAVLRGAELISRVAQHTGEDTAPEHLIPRIFNAIQQALDEARTTLEQVAGIGIATPGPLDHRTGIVYDPPNMPGWDRVPLRDIFEQHFSLASKEGNAAQLRVFVENDANAAGLGEYLFGIGRGCSNMVYLTISTGIGGGVIVDGKIVEGASGTAGELGHMTIDRNGGRCRCGNYGCLEYLASGTAILHTKLQDLGTQVALATWRFRILPLVLSHRQRRLVYQWHEQSLQTRRKLLVLASSTSSTSSTHK